MVSGSGSLLASATVPIMVVRGRCACLHSACCGWPTSDGPKALKVLGARYATLRVIRGLGVCTTPIRVWGQFWQCALQGSLGGPVGDF